MALTVLCRIAVQNLISMPNLGSCGPCCSAAMHAYVCDTSLLHSDLLLTVSPGSRLIEYTCSTHAQYLVPNMVSVSNLVMRATLSGLCTQQNTAHEAHLHSPLLLTVVSCRKAFRLGKFLQDFNNIRKSNATGATTAPLGNSPLHLFASTPSCMALCSMSSDIQFLCT